MSPERPAARHTFGHTVLHQDARSHPRLDSEDRISLYQEIGGEASIDAALDSFYPKILGDPRVSFLFEGVDMARLRTHARAFLAMAFGGPNDYQGRDLRAAHTRARGQGLNDALFEVFMGHFRSTLQELGVPKPKLTEIVSIAESGRNDVLNR